MTFTNQTRLLYFAFDDANIYEFIDEKIGWRLWSVKLPIPKYAKRHGDGLHMIPIKHGEFCSIDHPEQTKAMSFNNGVWQMTASGVQILG